MKDNPGGKSYDARGLAWPVWPTVPTSLRSRRSNKVKAARDTGLFRQQPLHACPCPDSPLSFRSASVRISVDDAAGFAVITTHTMAAAAVDVGYLAASYSVPESTIQSLLSAPTVDLVQSLLTQIEAKARDFEDLQSEKLKADVELDNAVQSGEQRARALKAAADSAQKEAAELRQKVAQEGAYTGRAAAGGIC
jgi:hypothetical protein